MENANTRRETTPLINPESNLLSTNPKEDNDKNIKIMSKITESNNHYFIISLTINGLNSPIRRHRKTD